MGRYIGRLGTALLGALLGWVVMVFVAAAIDTTLVAILVFWPIYGVSFLLAGLIGAVIAAAIPLRSALRIWLAAAAFTILLFALVPAWFLWLNQGSTRF